MIIDKREPEFIRDKLKDISTLQQLEVGDYIIRDELYERKTARDLVASLLDGRLFQQVKNLKGQTEYKTIIAVTGNIWKALFQSRMKPSENIYFGLLHALEVRFQIPILYFYDDIEFIAYLRYINSNDASNTRTPSLPIRKSKRIELLRIDGLSCIRGVSTKRSTYLMDKFKTIKNIANATIEEIISDKINDKTAKQVFDFFNG